MARRGGPGRPTLLDDADNAAAQAVGVSRFPFMVFVGPTARW
jgi:hypothetical protein